MIEIPVASPELQAGSGHPSAGMCSGMRLSNYIDKYEQSNAFVPGNRHSYLVKLSSALNNAGFSPYDAARECVRRLRLGRLPDCRGRDDGKRHLPALQCFARELCVPSGWDLFCPEICQICQVCHPLSKNGTKGCRTWRM